jgi:hypothetical protein
VFFSVRWLLLMLLLCVLLEEVAIAVAVVVGSDPIPLKVKRIIFHVLRLLCRPCSLLLRNLGLERPLLVREAEVGHGVLSLPARAAEPPKHPPAQRHSSPTAQQHHEKRVGQHTPLRF